MIASLSSVGGGDSGSGEVAKAMEGGDGSKKKYKSEPAVRSQSIRGDGDGNAGDGSNESDDASVASHESDGDEETTMETATEKESRLTQRVKMLRKELKEAEKNAQSARKLSVMPRMVLCLQKLQLTQSAKGKVRSCQAS